MDRETIYLLIGLGWSFLLSPYTRPAVARVRRVIVAHRQRTMLRDVGRTIARKGDLNSRDLWAGSYWHRTVMKPLSDGFDVDVVVARQP